METDVNFGLELIGTQPQPAAPQRSQLSGADLRLRNAETWVPVNLEPGIPQARQDVSRVGSGRSGPQGSAGTCTQVGRLTHSVLFCLPHIPLYHGFQPAVPSMSAANMA